MTTRVQVTWLDASEVMSAAELCKVCGFSPAELDELVEYGALAPLAPPAPAPAPAGPSFSGAWVAPLREAARLRRDYDLDIFTVAVLLGYLDRIESLERELHSLRARIPGHAHPAREGPQPWREPHG